jgi:antitoxin (DNA-binding transcriptional repressor) of toxin-antitoxin stability system
MPAKTVDVREAQTRLTELLSLVAEGTEVILTQGDTPLARILPITPPDSPRVAGLHPGAIWTSDDFDEPLSDELSSIMRWRYRACPRITRTPSIAS